MAGSSGSIAIRSRCKRRVSGWRPFGDRVTLVHGAFGDVGLHLQKLGLQVIDGFVLDLGVSSPQLDVGPRAAFPSATKGRSTCAWTARPARRPKTSSAASVSTSWPTCCVTTAKSATPAASPARSKKP